MTTEPRPVRRVPLGQYYWAVAMREKSSRHGSMEVYKIIERGDPIDREHYESGNYFPERSQAEEIRSRHLRDLANAQKREAYHANKQKKTNGKRTAK